MLRLVVLAVMLAVATAKPSTGAFAVCQISDITSLHDCFRQASVYERFEFTQDVSCADERSCCPAGARGLMTLVGLSGRSIDGHGHVLKRMAGQKTCPALFIQQASDIAVQKLTFDEDAATPPCELAEHDCPSTLDIATAHDVSLDGIAVRSGKGYVVRIWAVRGLTMRRSEIRDAGIIGLYVGHYLYGASGNITIEDSRFLRSRANGVAIQGGDDVVLKDNLFVDNHWHGLWPVPNIPGGITPGGQLLIAQGSRIMVAGNVFRGVDCGNCRPARHIVAVEVGEDAAAPGVHGFTLSENVFCYATAGLAIAQNPGTRVSSASVERNRIAGFEVLDNLLGGVHRADNAKGPAGDPACRRL